HFAGFKILHRLICPAMPELQFEGSTAERLPKNLVAKADAENGNAGIYEIANGADCVAEGGGVAWTVGKKNAGRLVLERLRGGRRSRNHLYLEPALAQPAHDVVLHAEIVGHDGNIGRGQGIANVAAVARGG